MTGRDDGIRRRDLLRAVGGVALASGLAGCGASIPDGGGLSASGPGVSVTVTGVDPCQPVRKLLQAYQENSPVVWRPAGSDGGDGGDGGGGDGGGGAAGGCGNLWGDPHLRTIDGNSYDFMGAGEFVAVESTDDDLAVQVRLEPWGDSDRISVLTAAAARVGEQVVEFTGDADGTLLVDGDPTVLETGETVDLDDGYVLRNGEESVWGVVWTDGTVMTVTESGSLDVAFSPQPNWTGDLRGLLGDADGDAGDDLVTRDGSEVSEEFEDLYGTFAADWRVTDESSLFTYAEGESTATYADPSFPAAPPPELSGDVRRAARRTCFDAGVRDPTILRNCVLDVGLTGDEAFATRAAANQERRTVVPGTGPAPVGNADPQALRRGDPARTGRMPADGGIQGVTEWTSEADLLFETMPVAAGDAVLWGSERRVLVLEATDGSVRWSKSVRRPRTTPTLAGSVAYVPTDEGLLALDLDDGTEYWRIVAFADEQLRSPVVADGSVYCSLLVDGVVVVFAADAETGELRWERVLGAAGSYGAVAVADGTAYASYGATLAAVDVADGSVRWRTRAPFGIGSAVAVADGAAYVTGTNGGIVAFDAASGERQWVFERDFYWSAPAVDDDRVYAGSADALYAVDRADGSLAWELPVESIPRDPVLAGDALYASTQRGVLFAVDASSGEVRWRESLGDSGEVDFGPFLDGDRLYVTDRNGSVRSIR